MNPCNPRLVPLKGLHNSSNKVVLHAFGNFDLMEFSRAYGTLSDIINENVTIDVRSLCLHAGLEQQLRLVRRTLEQNLDTTSHHSAKFAFRDRRLGLHHLIPTTRCGTPRNLVVEVESTRAFFVRIEKHADVIERDVVHEGQNLAEVLFIFSGKAGDEGRAQARHWIPFANVL